METTAILKNVRVAPRKMRMVADLVRGKKVVEAQLVLGFLAKKGTLHIGKALASAIASAKNLLQQDESNLYISRIAVNEGPKLKRWRPRAKGSAYPIQKKTSTIILTLNQIEGTTITKVAPEAHKETGKDKEAKETVKKEKPAFKAGPRVAQKPKKERGVQRIFRRKAV